ncbi:hypothetical protein OUZ56_014933 [Daphnia magna]|uniref:Uncharacterized protein n=1 Tax=Daphnia magna TaxID=35525 RepID=A0ABR0ALB4_9CRUS|nr:hypothetical protein OUZ56_014933 [Daphnia magna]
MGPYGVAQIYNPVSIVFGLEKTCLAREEPKVSSLLVKIQIFDFRLLSKDGNALPHSSEI